MIFRKLTKKQEEQVTGGIEGTPDIDGNCVGSCLNFCVDGTKVKITPKNCYDAYASGQDPYRSSYPF